MLWVRHLPVRVSTVFRKLNYIYRVQLNTLQGRKYLQK